MKRIFVGKKDVAYVKDEHSYYTATIATRRMGVQEILIDERVLPMLKACIRNIESKMEKVK